MTKDEARRILKVDNDAKLAAALSIGKSTVSQWPDEWLPRSAQDKVLAEYARKELVAKAQERGLVDDHGRPNVGRYLALVSYADVQDACSCRQFAKNDAGLDCNAKGLMLQINRRIKSALGHPVPDLSKDSETQDVVAMVRRRVANILLESGVDYTADDWREQDSALKDRVYNIIDGMIKTWMSFNDK